MNIDNWISKIKSRFCKDDRILINFEKFICEYKDYINFEPTTNTTVLNGENFNLSLYWKSKEKNELLVSIGKIGTIFYKISDNNNNNNNNADIYTYKYYCAESELKESDFPEADIKIVHGEAQ